MQPEYAPPYMCNTDQEVLNPLSVIRARDSNIVDASTLKGLELFLKSINPYTKYSVRHEVGFSNIQPKTSIYENGIVEENESSTD